MVRELKEEIGHSVPAERFEYLTSFTERNADGKVVAFTANFSLLRILRTTG